MYLISASYGKSALVSRASIFAQIGLITRRSLVQIRSPQPTTARVLEIFQDPFLLAISDIYFPGYRADTPGIRKKSVKVTG